MDRRVDLLYESATCWCVFATLEPIFSLMTVRPNAKSRRKEEHEGLIARGLRYVT
jgi:hypothetical protein